MHKKYAKVATCQLNQWAMSFTYNKANIIKSIQMARAMGATYRLGPELEITGYSCEDHFFEIDTVNHSWEVLADILQDKENTRDMLCDFGMPVIHKGTLYNCRVFCLNQEILLIRPKLHMADGNNYRENRWFYPWRQTGLDEHVLPTVIQNVIGQRTVKIGDAVI
jgi:NAD+ synthase (glutamine-hydrolysing)